MDKALHHAAAALLGQGGSSCLCCNTGSQKKSRSIHKHSLCKAQVQHSAQQGWLWGARAEAKEGNRTKATIGAIALARYCIHIYFLPFPR